MKNWEKIVILHPNDKNRRRLEVRDSQEAARALLKSWPAEQGKSYRRAVLSCSAAINDKVPHDAAQWAFIVAVMEAAIPYEIVDRLDLEIAAVCRELLEGETWQKPGPAPTVADAAVPTFWWPKPAVSKHHATQRRVAALPQTDGRGGGEFSSTP